MFIQKQCVWGAALLAVFTFGAAAQTADVTELLEKGQDLRARGQYAEARTVFAGILRDRQNIRVDDRLTGIVLDNVGANETDAGNYGAAEAAFNRSLSLLHTDRPNDPLMSALKTHLSELYIAEQRPEDAEPLLRQAIAAILSTERVDPLAVSLAYENLAVVCVARHKREEADTLLRRAIGLMEATLGPDHPRVASPLLTYAGLLVMEHHYADAVAPAERAWQILRSANPPMPNSYLAGASSILGAVYFHVGRSADAVSFSRRAVELAEEVYGPDHPQVAVYLGNYAEVLKKSDRKKEARDMQSRAEAIRAGSSMSASLAGYTVAVDALR